MSETQDADALQSRVRSWLLPEILDAEESRRTWRLRTIQVEAERRSLRIQAVAGALSLTDGGSPSSASRALAVGSRTGSPRALEALEGGGGSPGAPSSGHGGGSPVAPAADRYRLDAADTDGNAALDGTWTQGTISGNTLIWVSGKTQTIEVVDETEIALIVNGATCTGKLEEDGKLHWSDGDVWTRAVEVDVALGKTLAFERHIANLRALLANFESDVDAVSECIPDLEASLADRRAYAREAAERARVVRKNMELTTKSQQDTREEHDSKCKLFVDEARVLQAYAMPMEAVELELDSIQEEHGYLASAVQLLEEDVAGIARRRECMWMCREETLSRRRDLVQSHSHSTREASAAKHAAQARAAALTRLQGDVLRTRSKSERKRRVLEGNLTQCRSELADATEKSNSAGDKWRKLKQQQGKQLREMRLETQGLQSEVDEHLLAIENTEGSARALRSEEAELENHRLHHVSEEFALEERAAGLRIDASRLEHEVEAQQATAQLGLAHLRRAETDLAEEEQLASSLQAEAHRLMLAAEATELTMDKLKGEMHEEQRLCGLQTEAVEELEAKQVKGLRAKNSELSAQHLQLQDSAKKTRKDSEKHFSDMQEAFRRLSRLKSQHGELVELASTRAREALIGAMDQALARVNKKAEAVMSCLDAPGQSRLSDGHQAASLSRTGHAALQRRLQAEYERGVETLLAEERRRVVLEQQRSLTEARRRSSALQKVQQERRRLQEDLARCQQAYDWARRSSESELHGLEAQVKLVSNEATEGVEAVTAEFSDLLQKQALERDVLQRQVEELRGQLEGGNLRAQDDALEDDGGDAMQTLPNSTLLQRLALEEAEADALRAQEEELNQAHVKLKAALVASKQRKEAPGKLQPLTHASAAHERKPARASATAPRRGSRSPSNPPTQASSSSTLVPPARTAASAVPKTPPKSAERWREGPVTPVPTIVCTSDVHEAAQGVPSTDLGSEVVASPNPVVPLSPERARQCQHRRIVSANAASSAASSLSISAAAQIGAQLSGSTRSVSSHSASASTSGSKENLQSTLLGGGPLGVRTAAGGVSTWPSGMPTIPSQQDLVTKGAAEPRGMNTLG